MIVMRRNQDLGRLAVKSIQNPGFTITELLIVVSIAGIVTSLGISWLRNQIPKITLQGAVQQIRSDLLAVRMQAARERNPVRIRFLDAHRYAIHDDDNHNGKPDQGERMLVRDLRDHYRGVTLQSTNQPIFHPRGTASNLATITLSNITGSMRIKVNITGRVTVTSS